MKGKDMSRSKSFMRFLASVGAVDDARKSGFDQRLSRQQADEAHRLNNSKHFGGRLGVFCPSRSKSK